jgi:protein-disulfide isomerase
MRLLRYAAIAAAAVLSIAAAPAQRGNWLTTVAVTPTGAHQIGNPAAPVKLVEYVSYTCSHCAHFNKEADVPLRLAYVQPGKVQIEIRHLVRDPIDMTVAMMTNCGTPSRFYLNHTLFLSTQDQWMGRAQKAGPAQQARWNTGANSARFRAIASDMGFYSLMERRGYDRATIDRCFADEALTRRLAAMTAGARDAGVNGTPSFLLNGALLADTHDWQSLKPQLDARF